MSYSIYEASIAPMRAMLKNLSKILDKAVAQAKDKKIPEEALICARLAPDMFPFPRQIDMATNSAVQLSARLRGVEVPDLGPTGKSFADFQARIARAIAVLEQGGAEAYAGAEDRKIAFNGHAGPEVWTGRDYASLDRLPNFYFHVVTAYAILRHNNIDVGKRDYLGK